MATDNQNAEKYRRLYNALTQGDYADAKKMLSGENQTFVQFMDDYIAQHGLVRQTILQKADIPVAVGYKYLSGSKRTKNRNTIIRLCIGMEMPLADVQKALNLYGMSALGGSDRDCVIIAGIDHRSTVDEIHEWLQSLSLEPLMDLYDR